MKRAKMETTDDADENYMLLLMHQFLLFLSFLYFSHMTGLLSMKLKEKLNNYDSTGFDMVIMRASITTF